MIKKLVIFLVIPCLFLSCAKVQIPSYIEVDSYYNKVNAATQGTNNQDFTDMLVYANGQAYGTYPLGSKIPVLTSGLTSFVIRGVIKVNGVEYLRSDYELMKGCDTLINVIQGQVTKVVPVFEYFPTAQFRYMWDDDGESGSIDPTYSGHLETTVTYTPGFGGVGKCLALRPYNNADSLPASVKTHTIVYLPPGGVGVYIEFNYQGNIGIEVYIEATDGITNVGVLQDCGGVYSSAVWKKTYIDLTEQVSSTQSPTGYTVYFTAFADPTLTGNQQALIDNIKIISAQ